MLLTIAAGVTSLYYLPGPYERPFDRAVKGDHWTPISRVVGYPPQGAGEAALTYDQDFAPVPHHRRGERLPDWNQLELGPQSIGYELTGPGPRAGDRRRRRARHLQRAVRAASAST